MNKFKEELSHWNEYDYVFVNDDLETCYNNILEIMDSVKKGKTINQDSNEIRKKNSRTIQIILRISSLFCRTFHYLILLVFDLVSNLIHWLLTYHY